MVTPATHSSAEQAHAWSARGEVMEVSEDRLFLSIGGPRGSARVIEVDRAGRVSFGHGRRRLAGLAFAGVEGPLDRTQAVLAAAMASVNPSEADLLKVLHSFVGERMPWSPLGVGASFAVEDPLPPLEAGIRLSAPQMRGAEGGLWRSGFLEAVRTAKFTVIVRTKDAFQVIEDDLAIVWSALNGSTEDELSENLGVDVARVDQAVDELRDRGLVAERAQWRVADDTVWTWSDTDAFFLSRVGNLTPPVVVDGWGAVIWAIVSEMGSIATEEVVRRIETENDIRHDITRDVEGFVIELCSRGFVAC